MMYIYFISFFRNSISICFGFFVRKRWKLIKKNSIYFERERESMVALIITAIDEFVFMKFCVIY